MLAQLITIFFIKKFFKCLLQFNALRPDLDRVTIFTDAAWKHETKDVGFGWVIRNCPELTALHYQSAARNVRLPLMAEAIALFLALQYAQSIGITKLSMASDSQQLITAITSESPSTEFYGIIFDILNLSLGFADVSFSFVPRSENRVADELAKSSLISFSIVPGSTGLNL
ncbi:putative proteins [Arabidopsis thaliana]|uniref:Polynucleotidyl transferase, ribonuclease H-like superfamily protein n=1 Tax=Arabidopsis thaliana TaxID=3702 RepID=Q9M0P4_ARATH|nr:Polynucleotidyl transferase, ribonuclease H-like superfamily protein [Arabidopsis thaliana]AEE82756.1 Polynucleotidyl transferase, ribonuclease H-like superfamily protein [Arabidopsis thaliana]CAB78072.1 putative proteins [Arabidopsis thaliana]|eukprot:NP_192687.1 Polynucleotidyl transferase, ribonuclease H-like superfamily protein [Arabidopsis thaliana]